MHELRDHIVALLGLSEADELTLVATTLLPERSVGLGDAAAVASPEQIRASILDNPASSLLVMKPEPEPDVVDLPFEVRTQDSAPTVVIFQSIRAPFEALEGTIHPFVHGAHFVSLDSERCVLSFDASDAEYVAVGVPPGEERGRIAVYRCRRAAGASVRAEVDAGVLLGDAPCESWLREAVTTLAGGASAFDGAAAVGLVARLWVPTWDSFIGNDAPTPSERAQRWAEALSPEARHALLVEACAEAERVTDELTRLSDLTAENPATAAPIAEWAMLRRDDLASVSWVLDKNANEIKALRVSLQALDEEARAQMSALELLDLQASDERLFAVGWQDPLLWWGLVAEP